MQRETVLKKEFSQKDVQRARNLVTGNASAATSLQAGYEKYRQDYKEGDVWEEQGRTWTIKNGLKQNITKFDSLKKLLVLPLACPNCGKALKLTELNKKMYAIHQTCFDCVIENEAKLKREGKFEAYQKAILNGNKNAVLEDLERALDGWLNETTSFVSEDGVVEEWSKVKLKSEDFDGVREEIKKAKEQEI